MNREKLITLLEPVKLHILRYVSPLYVWIACTLCVVWMASSLTARLIATGQQHGMLALDRGQRVVYHLAGGEIDGMPRHTKRETEVADPLVAPAPVVGKGGAVVNETFAGKEGLAAAPFDAITEQAEKGLIPTAGRDGTLPWKYYARPASPQAGTKPMVAILFTNLGLSRPLTEEVLKLPHTFTLSFSPYASDAKVWARKARGEGFESLIDLPMEPANFPISDPGPYGLLNSLDAAENSNRMHWTLSRYPGFIGVVAPTSEKMTSNVSAMRSVLTELTARGVLFLYRKTPQNRELEDLARKQSLIALGVDSVIDEDLSPASIARQLNELTALAARQGYAVGIAHSYPPTLRALELWMETLPSKNVDAVPVSAIARKLLP